jgi:hypothetical protein
VMKTFKLLKENGFENSLRFLQWQEWKCVQCWRHIEHKGDYVEKWGIETKYLFWAMVCVLFHFNTLAGKKDTNMEALLSRHPVWFRYILYIQSMQHFF